MSDGAYVALSGLSLRLRQLDLLSADISNAETIGYKSIRSANEVAPRDGFETELLRSSVDVKAGPQKVDFRTGTLQPTGRELDVAINGPGFFVLNTPQGPRYTRNGHFVRATDGTLTASDGSTIEGDGGPIKLGQGDTRVQDNGTVLTNGLPVGRLQVVTFDDNDALMHQGARFQAPEGVTPSPATALVRGGVLEQSNVSVFERLAQLTEVTREFESLQRAIQTVLTDIDGKTISELGRR